MKEIQQALRKKRAQQAQLAREIELLEQAEEKLREIAPLLTGIDEDEAGILAEVDEEGRQPLAKAAKAAAGSQPDSTPSAPARTPVPRWP
jgi:predicted ribosome quality control (RQC) complex YloA/Tae2 family protein